MRRQRAQAGRNDYIDGIARGVRRETGFERIPARLLRRAR
jgi:hypothetical protein